MKQVMRVYRRMGYAEREGEAIRIRNIKRQRRKELILMTIISGATFGFLAWAFWMYLNGNTPIW